MALQIAARTPPDLVLLDIMMPGMDGYEVCRRLRQMPETAEVPIIFLSSLEEVQNKSRGFEAGANDYVTKPFEPARSEGPGALAAQGEGLQRRGQGAARRRPARRARHPDGHDPAGFFRRWRSIRRRTGRACSNRRAKSAATCTAPSPATPGGSCCSSAMFRARASRRRSSWCAPAPSCACSGGDIASRNASSRGSTTSSPPTTRPACS